jgi:hypothetical protein
MCFSPQGDLVGGTVVVAIGIDACLHVRGRAEYVALAALPIFFGLHQIDESLVWFWLQGHLSHAVGIVAMWFYLVFAMLLLPVAVPTMVLFLEPTRRQRWRMVPFILLGIFVATVILEAMLIGNPSAHLGSYHVAYSISLHHGLFFVGLYIIATCGSLLLSGLRTVVWFGVANFAVVIALAFLSADGFASLWCFYAAIVSGAIALLLRFGKQHPDRPDEPQPSIARLADHANNS